MTLQNLRYVVEVANSRSFSRAARSLFMTQSALSSAIRDVEDELGITIFRRTNRGVQLTPDGEDCLKHCKEIIERADYLSIRYQSRNSLRTYFSVSAQHLPFAVRAFDELLDHFAPAGYDVAIRETETARILHDVSTGRSEIGVAALAEKQLSLINKSLYIHDLSFTELARLSTYVFMRRRHPLAERDRLSLDDLRPFEPREKVIESSSPSTRRRPPATTPRRACSTRPWCATCTCRTAPRRCPSFAPPMPSPSAWTCPTSTRTSISSAATRRWWPSPSPTSRSPYWWAC